MLQIVSLSFNFSNELKSRPGTTDEIEEIVESVKATEVKDVARDRLVTMTRDALATKPIRTLQVVIIERANVRTDTLVETRAEMTEPGIVTGPIAGIEATVA